jgi:cytochrome c peroxidase
MKNTGVRAVPSLRYLENTPKFTIGPTLAISDTGAPVTAVIPPADVKVAAAAKSGKNSLALAAAKANVPQGGLDWDGRGETFQSQALGPLLDPNEMANHNAGDVLDHLKHAAYADDLRQLFGAHVFEQPDLALTQALIALVRFQIEDPSFHPYDSKYDAFLAGKLQLSEAEMRGMKLFEDPLKGNCSSCHIDKPSIDGDFQPAFTDYRFRALAAPRNRDIPANSDPHYYDLGLCGPYRTDYAKAAAYCGLFKTPTLRNAATRNVFFHNGVFHSLDDVIHFHVERDTNPAKWYPKLAKGEVDRYNDLPLEYRGNVDVAGAPFDRKRGGNPALNNEEIADLIAFLKTLTDGYQIGQPSAEQHRKPGK